MPFILKTKKLCNYHFFLYQDDKTQFLKCVIEPMMNVIFSMINVLLMKFSLWNRPLAQKCHRILLSCVWNKRLIIITDQIYPVRILSHRAFIMSLFTSVNYTTYTKFFFCNENTSIPQIRNEEYFLYFYFNLISVSVARKVSKPFYYSTWP